MTATCAHSTSTITYTARTVLINPMLFLFSTFMLNSTSQNRVAAIHLRIIHPTIWRLFQKHSPSHPFDELFSVTCQIFRATGANCFRSVDNRTLFSFHSVSVEIKLSVRENKRKFHPTGWETWRVRTTKHLS